MSRIYNVEFSDSQLLVSSLTDLDDSGSRTTLANTSGGVSNISSSVAGAGGIFAAANSSEATTETWSYTQPTPNTTCNYLLYI